MLGTELTRKFVMAAVILLAVTGVQFMPTQSIKAADLVPIPELDIWLADMLTFGERQCRYFREPGWEGGQGDTFYDAARVYYQIRDYTQDSKWDICAQLAATKYRDTQIGTSGAAPWNNFSTGLRMHYQRTGDVLSRQAVHTLATTMVARDSTLTGGTANPNEGSTWDIAREIAYAIKNHLDDEELGAPHRSRLEELVNLSIKHYDQWFVSKQAITNPVPSQYGAIGIMPYMVGLSMQSLIRYYEKYQDPRIPPLIRLGCNELYQVAWRPQNGGFYYNSGLAIVDTKDNVPAGLNLLIAPAYAWMYKTTGETVYRDRGDEIFREGVRRSRLASTNGADPNANGSWMYSGKQFNQEYMWSFDYIYWRSAPSIKSAAPSPPRNLRF